MSNTITHAPGFVQQADARLSRLTTAARLALLRPEAPVQVDDPTIVRAERLTLRPLRGRDRDEFVGALGASRDALARFCPLDKPAEGVVTDEDVFARQLLLSERGLETGLAWRRVAIDDDGRLVGSVAINDIRRGLEHSGELVFWISTEFAGRGYAGECVRAAKAAAFTDPPRGLGLHRLGALVSADNTPSLAVLRRCGFALGPETVPIDLILSGRTAPHDVYAAYAPLAEPARPAGSDERRLARALASILHAEAAAHAGV